MNIKDEILKLIGDEKIVAISMQRSEDKRIKLYTGDSERIECALMNLDSDFENAYRPLLYVWTTESIVITTTDSYGYEYEKVPRNPTDNTIEVYGG